MYNESVANITVTDCRSYALIKLRYRVRYCFMFTERIRGGYFFDQPNEKVSGQCRYENNGGGNISLLLRQLGVTLFVLSCNVHIT